MSQTVSFAEFGKSKGVSRQAVAKARRSGRLHKSIGRDAKGRACITDAALASKEWDDNMQQLPNDGRRKTTPFVGRSRCGMPLVPAHKFSVLSGGDHCVVIRIGDDDADFEDATVWPISRETALTMGRALVAAAQRKEDDFATAEAELAAERQ